MNTAHVLLQVAVHLGHIVALGTREHDLFVQGSLVHFQALFGGGLVVALVALVLDPFVHGFFVLLQVAGSGGFVITVWTRKPAKKCILSKIIHLFKPFYHHYFADFKCLTKKI